jgi:hypothetical protein
MDPYGDKSRLHETTTTVVIIGVGAEPVGQSNQQSGPGNKHQFSHGINACGLTVAGTLLACVAMDAVPTDCRRDRILQAKPLPASLATQACSCRCRVA